MARNPMIFTTAAYQYLADGIVGAGGFAAGEIERREFPDGERFYQLRSEADCVDAVLVGGTVCDRDTLELYDLAWALVEAGARSLTLVVPYFGYSTMERAVHPGEVVMAKSRAQLFSSIPSAGGGNRIVLFDLHSEGLPYYFEGHVRPVHLYGKRIVTETAREIAGGGEFVFACTDAGRAKWVESLANDMGVEAAFVYKRRIDGRRTEVAGVSARVKDKYVVIYDDMIRTGGSLLKAAAAYREAGAQGIAAITTHGIFPEDSLQKIQAAGLIDRIVSTDSHPRAVRLACDYLQVKTVAPLFAEYLAAATKRSAG
jgi:ribose-phosphate pyrophosphokinase